MRSSFSLVVLAVVSVLILSGCASKSNALLEASMNKDVVMAKQLIQRGEDINTGNEFGETPIHWGVINNDFELVDHLIRNGANIETMDEFGRTPLCIAASAADLQLVRLLVQNKANVNVITKHRTKFVSKRYDGRGDIYAKSGFRVAGKDVIVRMRTLSSGNTPLHFASYLGRKDVAKVLIASGAKVDTEDANGETPLMIAAIAGQVEFMKYLESNGADRYQISSRGKSASDYLELYYSIAKNADERMEWHHALVKKTNEEIKQKQEQKRIKQEQDALKAQREAQEGTGFQWGKFAAISTGVAIGGGALDSSSKASLFVGAALDSQAGVKGASNTQGQMNNVQQNYESKRQIQEQAQQSRQNSNNQGLPIAKSANSTGKASGASKTLVATVETRPVSPPLNTSANREVVQLLPPVSSSAWSDCKDQALNMDQKHRKANCTPGTLCEYGDGIRVSCVDSTGGAEPPTMSNQTRSCADLKRRAVSGGGQLVREFGCGCFNPNGTGYMDSYNNVTCQYLAIIQKNPDTQDSRGGAMSR